MLQQLDLHSAVGAGDADVFAQVAQRLGGHAPSPLTGQRGHARVIPAVHVALLHQAQQTAFAGHDIGEFQFGELDLLRMVDAQRVQIPVVKRAVVHVLQRAERMGHALNRVGLAMRPVVHRVDAPLIAGALVRRMADAVHHRIAQIDVGRTHVDLGAQHPCAIGKFTRLHALEQIQVFGDGTVAVGAVRARLGQSAAVGANFFLAEIVDVGVARFNELERPFVELAEVVGRVQDVWRLVAQPADVGQLGVDKLLLLFERVGVIEAQIAVAFVLRRHFKVQANRLRMSDMQITVRLRWEARLQPSVKAPVANVFRYRFTNEVARRRRGIEIAHQYSLGSWGFRWLWFDLRKVSIDHSFCTTHSPDNIQFFTAPSKNLPCEKWAVDSGAFFP